MKQNWEEGVAFVRGINMYKNARITQKKMLDLCKKIENHDLKIEKIVKTDNIIFKKKDMYYATVGSKLESILSAYFLNGQMAEVNTSNDLFNISI